MDTGTTTAQPMPPDTQASESAPGLRQAHPSWLLLAQEARMSQEGARGSQREPEGASRDQGGKGGARSRPPKIKKTKKTKKTQ